MRLASTLCVLLLTALPAVAEEGGAQRSVEALRQAAQAGDAGAQNELAQRLFDGDGVAVDKAEALAWLRRAAAGGNPDAQVTLGLHLRYGLGLERDEAAGSEWVRKAAAQGFARGQYWLADAYASGAGLPQDLREAVKWYRLAADQGHSGAQQRLGQMYAGKWWQEGAEELPRDDAEAVRWFRLSAEQGDPDGQFGLAEMIAAGRGTEQDLEEALSWYNRAADLGSSLAQNALGEAYEKGLGQERDLVCAYLWYAIAASGGFEVAERQRDALAHRLDAQQLAEAQRLARAADPEARPLRRPLCSDETISLKLTKAPLAEILAVFEELSGLHVVGAEKAIASGIPVTVDLDEATWEVGLSKVLAAQGCLWVREGETIHVVPAPKP